MVALSALIFSGSLLVAVPVQAVGPGDAGRFGTWVGYDVGRFPAAVEAAELNGDGLPDAVPLARVVRREGSDYHCD